MGEHSRYQANRAIERRQIETLLTYPKVGPLSAAAIAINLGTLRPRIEPILAALVAEGVVEQIDHDLYIGQGIERAIERGIGRAGQRRTAANTARGAEGE